MNQFTAALQDWSSSARLVPLWSNLALEDLRDRYRRTVLGLAWIIASFALFVTVKVFVFGQLTNVSAKEFGIYVTLGFGLWTYINAMVVDACTAYMHSRPWILGTSTPYPVFLLQAVFRNWLIFGMILLVMALAMFWKTTPWTTVSLSVFPALLVYAVSSLWLAAIPITPGGLGVVETVLTSALVGFGTPRGIAILGVVTYRLAKFITRHRAAANYAVDMDGPAGDNLCTRSNRAQHGHVAFAKNRLPGTHGAFEQQRSWLRFGFMLLRLDLREHAVAPTRQQGGHACRDARGVYTLKAKDAYVTLFQACEEVNDRRLAKVHARQIEHHRLAGKKAG